MSKQDDVDQVPDYINFQDDSTMDPYGGSIGSNEAQTGTGVDSDLIESGQVLSDGSKKEKGFGLGDIPLGVWMIVTVEIFERFSFYALRSQLVLFFQEALGMDENPAKALYSYFSSFSYFMPLAGSLLADAFLGRFWTITICTTIYAIGSYLLVYAAVKSSMALTYVSLLLIGFGVGAIKPNVNVFGATSLKTDNPAAVSAYFAIFYASINIGSVASTLILPIIKKHLGYSTAFLFPAVGLTIALIVFVLGYSRYVHVPPSSSLYKRMLDLALGARKGKKFIRQYADVIDQGVVDRVLTSKISRAQNIDSDLSAAYSAPKIDGIDVSVNDNDSGAGAVAGSMVDKVRKPSWLDNAKVFSNQNMSNNSTRFWTFYPFSHSSSRSFSVSTRPAPPSLSKQRKWIVLCLGLRFCQHKYVFMFLLRFAFLTAVFCAHRLN
jgi:hypothetical protein